MAGTITKPPTWTMSVRETWDLPFDTTNDLNLVSATAPSSPVVILTRQATGTVIPLTDDAEVEDKTIIQTIRGPSELVKSGTYLLSVTFVCSPTTNVATMLLKIIATS